MSTIEQATSFVSGNTKLLDLNGIDHRLEDLAAEGEQNLEVQALDDHGRLVTAIATDFRLVDWVKSYYSVTMSNGHVVEISGSSQFLTPAGDWVAAKDLSFGVLLKSATYNPAQKNPNFTINEISSVTLKELTEAQPVYGFTVKKQGNLFVAHQLDKIYSLICLHQTV